MGLLPQSAGFDAVRAVTELPAFEALVRALRAGNRDGQDSQDASGSSCESCESLSETPPRARATGLWGGSAGLVLAALAGRLGRPILAVTPTPEEADHLEDDLATFLERQVLTLPAYDVLPSETDSPEMPVLSARLSTLRRLSEYAAASPESPESTKSTKSTGGDGPKDARPPPVAVACVAALMQPVPAKDAAQKSELVLTVGLEVGLENLVKWLHEKGLERVPSITGRGEFAVRGGIVDVFPLYSDTLVQDLAPPSAPPSQAHAGEADEGMLQPYGEWPRGRAEERPVRVEFDGETVASLRAFDPVTQRSLSDMREYHVPGVDRAGALDPYTLGRPGTVAEHLAPGTLVVMVEPDEAMRAAELYSSSMSSSVSSSVSSVGGPGAGPWDRLLETFRGFPLLEVARISGPTGDATGDMIEEAQVDAGALRPPAELEFRVTSVQRLAGRAESVASRLEHIVSRLAAVTVYCRDATERARLRDILKRAGFAFPDYFETRLGRVSSGFEFRDLSWAALADHEILGVTSEHRRVRARARGEPIADFIDLSPGDYVVHATHGIARYLGMTALDKEGGAEDYLTLQFADNVRLYVPAGHAYLVERFVGAGVERPTLSKIGGSAWTRRKARAAKAVRDIAADLLRTQAERARTEGLAYPPDADWQVDFEAAFPYEETPDQLEAAGAIKGDMERPVPMDRLLCGDVGFGKTEVAMRAAFKAVAAGRQVAVLVPTTLLCEQHEKTFSERFASYPVKVGSLSRFKTRAQQKASLEELAAGTLDVVIGTHRLLSKDVEFRDLGLVVIDEEHRFGVEHKERLKQMRLAVDVLTLTATPIPRTLHMSMVGLRDISSLTIPPEDRLSIRTKVCRTSDDLVRRSVLREMSRGGQVYFVHDRVLDIDMVTGRLRAFLPEARFATVHGQMPERELETRMGSFLRREVDVLVTTTIIESGLDIPTVNTIFVNNADRFGLAQLHQLRGRVGRYRHQAYAYLLVPADRPVSRDAQKRLRALEEFEELGAGFKLAMRDLEIRGAGSLLGAEQSGHIGEIGYELYCRLLERTVREFKGEKVQEPVDVTLSLGWGARLPRSYVVDDVLKLELYRKLARARDEGEVAAVGEEMRDRLGPLPPEVQKVLAETRTRLRAQRAAVPYVARELSGRGGDGERGRLVFKMREPNFKRLEKRLRNSAGRFVVLPPDGFAVELPAYLLDDDNVEETAAGILKKLG